jgi:two-component system, sensor histidine kinase and response regulator
MPPVTTNLTRDLTNTATPIGHQLWVVDDEANNLTVIELLLSHNDYELSYFDRGMSMLEAMQDRLPDLILLDVMMPGIDGIELCHRLKRDDRTKHIPIVMVTALSSREDLSRCLEAGADDFISKPLNGLELRARVRSLLRIKRQYDELQGLVHLREEMLQLRMDLSHMVIHDLRNPLANILLSCQILQMRGLDDRTAPKIQQIEYAGHRLESMIDSLLMTAKLESGKLALHPTSVDLPELVQSVCAEFAAIAAQQGVNLVQELARGELRIEGDATLLRRVLDNLLSNALKFAPAQSDVTVAVLMHDDQVLLQVRDRGQGVNPELRDQIFAKFEVGQHLPQVKQIGLGLAFCKLVVEAHNGQIHVGDNQPSGCMFTITLPQLAPPLTALAAPSVNGDEIRVF